MRPVADYHMHTPLCGHATGSPSEYCDQAVQLGLEEIGFSDHAPFVHKVDPKVTMSREQLTDYLQMIEDVREEYHDRLRIKIALEADFIPGYEEKTRQILETFPYDYVIGSVHFIEEWEFDNPDEIARWNSGDVDLVWKKYFHLLQQSALSGLFDIMGHVDLPKKFGHQPTENLLPLVKETAEVFYETGVCVEINTAGLRKPCKEMYPTPEHLKIYCQAGIPLTFGSDAHQPDHVGCNFEEAFQLAKSVGYKEYLIFQNRQIAQTYLIE